MRPPKEMSAVIGGLRYSVDKATLIASDAYWDGHNWERKGRNSFLYRTPKGRYFVICLTQWQGEKDTLTPVEQDEALNMWEGALSEHEVEFDEAFPDAKIEEA